MAGFQQRCKENYRTPQVGLPRNKVNRLPSWTGQAADFGPFRRAGKIPPPLGAARPAPILHLCPLIIPPSPPGFQRGAWCEINPALRALFSGMQSRVRGPAKAAPPSIPHRDELTFLPRTAWRFARHSKASEFRQPFCGLGQRDSKLVRMVSEQVSSCSRHNLFGGGTNASNMSGKLICFKHPAAATGHAAPLCQRFRQTCGGVVCHRCIFDDLFAVQASGR